MSTLVYILYNIVLPIFSLMAVGFIARRKLSLDTGTLSRLIIYIMIPVVLFLKIYQSNLTAMLFITILFFMFCIEAFMLLAGEIVSRLLGYPRSVRKTFDNLLLFFNSGNYGLPLIDLAFKGNPLAMTSQAFIVLIQNIVSNTFGIFQASSGKSSYGKALRNILRTPLLYVLAAAIIIKASGFHLPDQVLLPVNYISNAFIGIALINLGAQLAEVRMSLKLRDVMALGTIRLLLSPLAGYLLVLALGLKGILAQSLIIGVSTPSAVNTAIIAREFDNEPEFASKGVFATTVLSTVTIPVVIYLVTKFL
jgi:malate permease and related proteins